MILLLAEHEVPEKTIVQDGQPEWGFVNGGSARKDLSPRIGNLKALLLLTEVAEKTTVSGIGNQNVILLSVEVPKMPEFQNTQPEHNSAFSGSVRKGHNSRTAI